MTPELAAFFGIEQPQQSNISTPAYLGYREGDTDEAVSVARETNILDSSRYGLSPDDAVKQSLTNPYKNGFNPNAPEQKAKAKGTTKPKNTDTNSDDDGSAGGKSISYTSEELKMFEKSANYLVDSISSFTNASLSWQSGKMKVEQYNFVAKQNEHAAELLYKNIADINRAAQLDANVSRLHGKNVKSAQKVAMAASGFAVGKGSYKTTLDTTDARTNYNVAMNMLKADLQIAETMRKAGEYKARAEIARGNAKIARIKARSDLQSGIISGVGDLMNAGVSFYAGQWGISKANSAALEDQEGE